MARPVEKPPLCDPFGCFSGEDGENRTQYDVCVVLFLCREQFWQPIWTWDFIIIDECEEITT
jgi:hypothetical protein